MQSLRWDQVSAWRLSQHALASRLERPDYAQAAMRTGGMQAQVMSAAELAIWARVDDLGPKGVQVALWQDRTLVKTWAMRAALHLIAAADLPLYVAARSLHEPRNWLRYFGYYGVTKTEYEAFVAAVPQILGSEPMTREELATAAAEHVGSDKLRDIVLSKGWGTPLKPSAWRGDLCFGPNRGRNVTFVRPSAWIGAWQPIEPYAALQEVARRYLRTYGTTTPELFARWWKIGLTPARRLFQSIKGELEAVEVEGWPALALRTTLEAMQRPAEPGIVRLLPLFDAYTIGLGRGAEIEPLLPKAHQNLVYRPQGWISAVVLVDGCIQGVWEYKSQRTQTRVAVHMFSSPTAAIRKALDGEAERLCSFLGARIILEYE